MFESREEIVRVLGGEGKIKTDWSRGLAKATDGPGGGLLVLVSFLGGVTLVTRFVVFAGLDLLWTALEGFRRRHGDGDTFWYLLSVLVTGSVVLLALRARHYGRLPKR